MNFVILNHQWFQIKCYDAGDGGRKTESEITNLFHVIYKYMYASFNLDYTSYVYY